MAIRKDMGRDCELSTTGVDARGQAIRPWDVTTAVLRHTDAAFEPFDHRCWTRPSGWRGGYGGGYGGGGGSAYSTDCMRHWAPNGQCFYSDMSHVEVCTASARSPRAYAAQCIATLLVVEAARARAEVEDGARYALSTANVDLVDPAIAWGTHDNVSISTELWENLFVDQRLPAVYGFVTSVMAAAIPFFGAGYLMPMRDGTTVFSLSGRAHHITRTKTTMTTQAFERGLLNARREPHGKGLERLHLIGFDFDLCSAALRSSFLQCCLAAAEEGYCDLALRAPLDALHKWSFGLDLANGTMPATSLRGGHAVTLPRYVRELATVMLEMCDAGLITPDVAPEATDLLPRVIELTHYAEEGSIARCAQNLDWAAKLMVLLELADQPGVRLGDAQTRLCDHDFANTDPARGDFWRLWQQGRIDPLVDRPAVDACLADGPAANRGYGRGRLIQTFGDSITDIDWSYVELRRDDDRWSPRLRIDMPTPASLSRDRIDPILARAGDVAQLEQLLDRQEHVPTSQAEPIQDIRSQLATPPPSGSSPGGSLVNPQQIEETT